MAKAKKTEEEKEVGIKSTIKDLIKKYGEGSIISSDEMPKDLTYVDSGSLSLNIALGGGVPVGKLVELMGQPSSGKSTLSLHCSANFQKAFPDKKVVYVDFEQSYDRKYAEALGVDVGELLIVQPNCAEDGYNMITELIRSKEVSLVVIDSHTAALPKAMVDGEVGQATIALQARINSQAVGKFKPLLRPFECTVIAISQMRANLGGYMVTQDATGGNAYKFYSDIRMRVSRKVDKTIESDITTVEAIKNKTANPYGKCEFKVEWGKGINRSLEAASMALELGLVVRGGAWITDPVIEQKFNGLAAMEEFVRDNPEYGKELEKRVLEELKSLPL